MELGVDLRAKIGILRRIEGQKIHPSDKHSCVELPVEEKKRVYTSLPFTEGSATMVCRISTKMRTLVACMAL